MSLIEACQRGDPQAFARLVELTNRGVYSLAFRMLGNPEDAADVTQDTYLKVVRSIKQFRGEAKFTTWLYRVTSSVAISKLRKRARRANEITIDDAQWATIPASAASDPVEASEKKLLRERLDQALLALPEGYRSVVVLKDIYGFSLADIGNHLGITEGAAKVRLFRARQRLRTMLYSPTGDS
ncbi:MAG: RNA polymerase sigma factor [Actinomycetota bacterium]